MTGTGLPKMFSLKDKVALITGASKGIGEEIARVYARAGANPKFGGLENLSEPEFDKVIDVNLKANIFLSQLAFSMWMKDHGGVIINVSSIGGYTCSTGINGYNIVKAALNHLTHCLASEWGGRGIRVNALAPGLVKTDFSKALWTDPGFQEMIKSQPIPRIGEVEDFAGAALFLASDASAFITGHILVADGGNLVMA